MTEVHVGRRTRGTVSLAWDLIDDAQGYEVHRWEPPRGQDPIEETWVGLFPGPFMIDCNLRADTTYFWRVTAMGIPDDMNDPRGTVRARTQPELRYPDSITFFTEFLGPTFARHLTTSGEATWCEQWWRHREARYAVQCLWEAWEDHRQNDVPENPNSKPQEWLTYFAYPTLDRLFRNSGPFIGCGGQNHEDVQHKDPVKSRPLPHVVDPVGTYLPT